MGNNFLKYWGNPKDGEEKVRTLIQRRKRGLALSLAAAITVGTAGLIYYAIEDEEEEYNNISPSSSGIPTSGYFQGNTYYFSRGATYSTGSWSRSSNYSGASHGYSGYSSFRGGISG